MSEEAHRVQKAGRRLFVSRAFRSGSDLGEVEIVRRKERTGEAEPVDCAGTAFAVPGPRRQYSTLLVARQLVIRTSWNGRELGAWRLRRGLWLKD
jgi:hypothetical protein